MIAMKAMYCGRRMKRYGPSIAACPPKIHTLFNRCRMPKWGCPMLRPEVVTCDCEQPYEQENTRPLIPRGRWGVPYPSRVLPFPS